MALTAKLSSMNDYPDHINQLNYVRELSQPHIEFYRRHLAIVEQKREIFERNVFPHVDRIMPTIEAHHELMQKFSRINFSNNFYFPSNPSENSNSEPYSPDTGNNNNSNSRDCIKRSTPDSNQSFTTMFAKIREKILDGVKPSRLETYSGFFDNFAYLLTLIVGLSEFVRRAGDDTIYLIVVFALRLATIL